MLRGTRPPAGTAGLLREFNRFREELAKLWRSEVSALHKAEPRARLKAEDLDRIQALIDALRQALAPIESLASSKPYDFAELAHRHREIMIELSRDEQGISVAFEDREGLALASAFDDLLRGGTTSGLMVTLPDYADVFQTAFSDRAVRRRDRPGARLQIYGPLESRLMQADRIIVGGLIEGLATGAAHRSVAEPADAAPAGPRSAGTPYRPLRA